MRSGFTLREPRGFYKGFISVPEKHCFLLGRLFPVYMVMVSLLAIYAEIGYILRYLIFLSASVQVCFTGCFCLAGTIFFLPCVIFHVFQF